jgi:hypothetical protein
MLWHTKKTETTLEPPMPTPEKKPLDEWNEKLEAYKKLAGRITVADGKPEIPEDVRKAFKDLGDLGKDHNEFKLFIAAQIDLDAGLHITRAGIMPWWLLHTGHAFIGDLAGLRRVNDEMLKAGQRQADCNAAFTWLSYSNALVEGYNNKITVGVLQQLMDWGADPNYQNGNWLEKSLRGGLNKDGLAPLINAGADAATVTRVLDDLRKAGKSQATVVEEAVRGKTLTGKVDDQILLQATFSPDGTTLKSYFNFASRRVQESHVQPGQPEGPLLSIAFDDYDSGAVDAAQKALEKKGGKPTPYRHSGNFGMQLLN